MTNEHEDIRVKLSAYVLGELEGDAAREVEAALKGSEELRAECERIRQTVGLVQQSFPPGDALSEDAMARLMAAAGASGRPAAAGSAGTASRFVAPLYRAAAVIAFVALGFALWRAQEARPRTTTETASRSRQSAQDTLLARREVDDAESKREEAGSSGTSGGYGGGGAPSAPADSIPAGEPVAGTTRDADRQAAGLALSKDAPVPDTTYELERGVEGIWEGSRTPPTAQVGRVVDGETASTVTLGTRLSTLDEVRVSNEVQADAEKLARLQSETAQREVLLGYGLVDPSPSAPPPGGSANLGVAASGNTTHTVVGVGGGAGGGAGGAYGGAYGGKSVKLVAPGAGGPSTPGPVAGGQVASGLPRTAVTPPGRSRRANDNKAPAERLEGLGYVGGGGGGGGEREFRARAELLDRLGADKRADSGSDDFFLGQGDARLGRSADGRSIVGPCELEGSFAGLQRVPDPLERRQLIERHLERLMGCCRPYPHETPRDMFFRYWGDNPFELATLDRLSTFAVDVDTASFTLARRYLREGKMPTKAQIRTEEFVNYFEPDLAPPAEGTFAVHTELAPSRFGGPLGRWMLRVGLRGREIQKTERMPLSLTFVIDTSGSMKEGGRMNLVKHALRLLVAELDGNDQLGIIIFNSNAQQVLPMTSVANRSLIEAAIHGLQPGGSTNAEAGLMMGYALAEQHLDNVRHSRVVMLSDGVANVGQTDQDRIAADVKAMREKGIYLNTVGVGMNNHNDVFLEQMANNGDGICNYVDDEKEAKRCLVDRFTGAFQAIARDVKIQVEFDPQVVYRYRLLGYENRAVADADFRNDQVDAGEVGAGHQVTALYELELTNPGPDANLGTVRVRWQQPRGAIGGELGEAPATEVESSVSYGSGVAYEAASPGYRRAVVVAQVAEVLRRSRHAKDDSLDDLVLELERLAPQLAGTDDGAFAEFAQLVSERKELIRQNLPVYGELERCLDQVRVNHYLDGLYRRVPNMDPGQMQRKLDEIEQGQQELQSVLREMIERQLEQEVGSEER